MNNNITEFPNMEGCLKLKKVNLSYNPITKIGPEMQKCDTILVNENQIEQKSEETKITIWDCNNPRNDMEMRRAQAHKILSLQTEKKYTVDQIEEMLLSIHSTGVPKLYISGRHGSWHYQELKKIGNHIYFSGC
eukprot:TRINITY_DN3787_c0_g2_i1.p1 TRINITY_DN3787_c0_g2~~TRINITY_DN3787_c0_g2_i1.p1  ORF type:complete len:134 (+),score=18.08 TRINITY_DN3787_c0_g2_i1:169-570(+)